MKIEDEVRMFLELCAGMASIQFLVGTNWRRTVRVDDSVGVYMEPMFQTETISLEKLAWQWHTTPQGRRLYMIKVGWGDITNTLAWSTPEQYVYHPIWRIWDELKL